MEGLLKFAWGAVTFFAPPADDPGCSPASNQWRWKVFGGVLVGYAAGALFGLWICGKFAGFGLVGMAWADDMSKAQSAITFLQQTNIEQNIRDDELAICRLEDAAQKQTADSYALQLAAARASKDFYAHLDIYRQLTGRMYPQRPCPIVLIAGGK